MRGDAPDATDRYASTAPRGRRRFSVAVLIAALTLSACGEDDFKNEPKPPATEQLTGVITKSRVTISPDSVGTPEDATQSDERSSNSEPPTKPPGGLPLRIVIDNQSGEAQEILLEGEGVKERVGPVIAGDTAILQKTLEEGKYTVSACRTTPGEEDTAPRGRGCESGGIGPATLTVGSTRRSSSDKVLLP